MAEIRIYVEGGSKKSDNNKELQARCREGFRKLLENSTLKGRVPRIVPCGSRKDAYDDFKTAVENGYTAYLIVDSEDPVTDGEKTWAHLKTRDNWDCPPDTTDEQVFLMTNCMETWLVADRAGLKKHYKQHLQESALPSLSNLESQDRHDVQDKLVRATRNCTNAYKKGKRSFEVLAAVDPKELLKLPAFDRMITILKRDLPTK